MTNRHMIPLAATFAVSVLAACGGGGSSSSPVTPSAPGSVGAPAPSAAPTAATTPAVHPSPTATPTVAPTPIPTATAAVAAVLGTAQLNGALGFVNAQQHTVYTFDADLALAGTSSACTGQCAAVWPAVAATANTAYQAPFTAFRRADGTLQLAYAGHPLYTYVADSAAGSVAGDGIVSFGNAWHIARPAGAVAAPAPTGTPPSGPTY